MRDAELTLVRGTATAGSQRASAHIALNPFIQELGNLQVVLLEHHHVPIAMDAFAFKPDLIGGRGLFVDIRAKNLVYDEKQIQDPL